MYMCPVPVSYVYRIGETTLLVLRIPYRAHHGRSTLTEILVIIGANFLDHLQGE